MPHLPLSTCEGIAAVPLLLIGAFLYLNSYKYGTPIPAFLIGTVVLTLLAGLIFFGICMMSVLSILMIVAVLTKVSLVRTVATKFSLVVRGGGRSGGTCMNSIGTSCLFFRNLCIPSSGGTSNFYVVRGLKSASFTNCLLGMYQFTHGC